MDLLLSGSRAPVQAVSSIFATLQCPIPTETSWYLVRLNESLCFLQDRLLSWGSRSLYALFSRNHIQVWGQIWCGKYGFELENMRGCPSESTDLARYLCFCPDHWLMEEFSDLQVAYSSTSYVYCIPLLVTDVSQAW
ncbi:hypothetical protein EDD15DRAFT_2547374 [Pisolithus albus]|nr:hypothetical protein EDD15DRAFT_2547374 [Pisolithus albus]